MGQVVSVIIPTANNESTIERAIKSVISENIEVIVVVNNSDDNTFLKVQNFAQNNKNVRVFQTDPGRSHARNIGLMEARGEFVCFLDADDEINIAFIKKGVDALIRHTEIKAVYASAMIMDDRTGISKKFRITQDKVAKLFVRNPFVIESVLFRRNVVESKFDESLSYCEDWLFWVTNFKPDEFRKIDVTSSVVHVTGKNTMSDLEMVTFFELDVRVKIMNKYRLKTRRGWLDDLKLIVKYFQCSKTPILDLWKTMPILTTIGWALTHIPVLTWISRKALYKSNSFNTYR